MNAIECLKNEIEQQLPSARASLRQPRDPNGHWWLDTMCGQVEVTIEWSPRRGFGLSVGDDVGYGEGPEETFDDAQQVLERALALLRSGA